MSEDKQKKVIPNVDEIYFRYAVFKSQLITLNQHFLFRYYLSLDSFLFAM